MPQTQIVPLSRDMNAVSSQVAVDFVAGRDRARVAEDTLPGWRKITAGPSTLWLKGHLFGDGERRLSRACSQGTTELRQAVADLDGCFAAIVEAPDFVFAAADRIGSIPVFVANRDTVGGRGHLVGGLALALTAKADLRTVNQDAA